MSELNVKKRVLKDLSNSKDIGQQAVETVVITRSSMSTYPAELLACKNTRFIHACMNKFSEIPNLGVYKKLTVCDLSNNRILAFPSSVLQCPNLKVLDISGNRLKCLSTRLAELRNLKVLRAGDNFIDDFPAEIFALKQIEIISLRNNQIKVLPSKIGSLKCLKMLFMELNLLMTIPFSIVNTPIAEEAGVLRLEKNLLVPTLLNAYNKSGKDGLFSVIIKNDQTLLYAKIEIELKHMALQMLDLQKTRVLKKRITYEKLKKKKIKLLISKQRDNVLSKSTENDIEPFIMSPISAKSIKIYSQPNLSPNGAEDVKITSSNLEKRKISKSVERSLPMITSIRHKVQSKFDSDEDSTKRSTSANSIFSKRKNSSSVHDSDSVFGSHTKSTDSSIPNSNESFNSPTPKLSRSIADNLNNWEEQLEQLQMELSPTEGVIRVSHQNEIFTVAQDLGILFENIYQRLDENVKVSSKRKFPINQDSSHRISIFPADFMKSIEDFVQEAVIIKEKAMAMGPATRQQRARSYKPLSEVDDSVQSNATLFDASKDQSEIFSNYSPVTISRKAQLSNNKKLVNKILDIEEKSVASPRKNTTRSVLANNFEEMMKSKDNIARTTEIEELNLRKISLDSQNTIAYPKETYQEELVSVKKSSVLLSRSTSRLNTSNRFASTHNKSSEDLITRSQIYQKGEAPIGAMFKNLFKSSNMSSSKTEIRRSKSVIIKTSRELLNK
eukprot:NODE_893_length_3357_cov_0.374463.p1 type:complete len:726 gc:universal NODE_893_length_3357_cov_0.374463:772-2949(+)